MASRNDSENERAQQLATRRAAENDVLMREVDEAVRKDEMLGAARKYGVISAVVVVVAVAAFGGWLLWDRHSESQLEERSEKLVTAYDALQSGQIAAAETALKPLAAQTGAGAASAKLALAGAAIGQNRQAEAIKLYGEVATDTSAPQPYRDLALVRQMAAQFEDVPPAEVVARLKPLAVPGNPWFGSAGEMVAMVYLKQNRPDLAGPLLGAIAKDEAVPDSLRSRTRQLAGLLGVDAIENVETTESRAQAAQTQAGAAPAAVPAP